MWLRAAAAVRRLQEGGRGRGGGGGRRRGEGGGVAGGGGQAEVHGRRSEAGPGSFQRGRLGIYAGDEEELSRDF